jgi:hypothetical protein
MKGEKVEGELCGIGRYRKHGIGVSMSYDGIHTIHFGETCLEFRSPL